MDFLKKNSYDIVRMFITQLGISVFALTMSISFSQITPDEKTFGSIAGNVAISVFSTGFYFVLLYMTAWDWGAKDKIKIDAGRMTGSGAKMLLMSLIANAPNLLLSFISVFCLIFSSLGIKFIFYAAGTISAIILRLASNMFNGATSEIFYFLRNTAEGADNSVYDLVQMTSFIFLFFLTVLVCHFGYTLGLKEKRIFGFIKIKPKKYE